MTRSLEHMWVDSFLIRASKAFSENRPEDSIDYLFTAISCYPHNKSLRESLIFYVKRYRKTPYVSPDTSNESRAVSSLFINKLWKYLKVKKLLDLHALCFAGTVGVNILLFLFIVHQNQHFKINIPLGNTRSPYSTTKENKQFTSMSNDVIKGIKTIADQYGETNKDIAIFSYVDSRKTDNIYALQKIILSTNDILIQRSETSDAGTAYMGIIWPSPKRDAYDICQYLQKIGVRKCQPSTIADL